MATRKSIEEKILELQAKIEELKSQDSSKHLETAKGYADAFMRKLQADGISLKTGLKAYKDLMAVSGDGGAVQRPPGSRVDKEPKAYVKGTVYKDPNSSATWTGGTKGRQPPWLVAALEGAADKAKAFAKLAVTGGDRVNNG